MRAVGLGVGAAVTREQLEKWCAEVGREIKAEMPDGVGFCLMMFDFGAGGSLAYVSSAQREDMIKALAEFRDKLIEGRQ